MCEYWHIDYWNRGQGWSHFESIVETYTTSIIAGAPCRSITTIPITQPLAPGSETATWAQTDELMLERSWVMQFVGAFIDWLSYYPPFPTLTPPLQIPSGLSPLLAEWCWHSVQVQHPPHLHLCTPSVLLQTASQHKPYTWLKQLVSLCPAPAPWLKLFSPWSYVLSLPHLLPAPQAFLPPSRVQIKSYLPEVSPTPIRTGILPFLWRMSSLNDLCLLFCI